MLGLIGSNTVIPPADEFVNSRLFIVLKNEYDVI